MNQNEPIVAGLQKQLKFILCSSSLLSDVIIVRRIVGCLSEEMPGGQE